MPDIGAERGQNEADTHQHRPAQSRSLAFPGPAASEEGEEEWHREVHDAVGGRANDTGNRPISLERPIIVIVLLEDAVAHGEAYAKGSADVRFSWCGGGSLGTPDR